MPTRRTIVIGAGPGGLVSAKVTLHMERDALGCSEFDPIILEAGDEIGGTFAQRSYENGALVSSKQLTAFSDCEKSPPTASEHRLSS